MKQFLGNFIGHSNPFLRRFTTECLVYLVKKVRKAGVLRRNLKFIFNVTLEDLGMEVTEKNQAIRDDFLGSLLYEILKGDQGYINEQCKDAAGVISELLELTEKHSYAAKAINLLVESEFRFYLRRRNDKKALGLRYKLEDFLGDLYEAKIERGDKLAAQILSILT